MVWAEMAMGRNGHGPKWLWAEMTSDRANGNGSVRSKSMGPIQFAKEISNTAYALASILAGTARQCYEKE